MSILKKLWTPAVKKALVALALAIAAALGFTLGGCNSVEILVVQESKTKSMAGSATTEQLLEIDAGATKQDTISPETQADVSVVPGS